MEYITPKQIREFKKGFRKRLIKIALAAQFLADDLKNIQLPVLQTKRLEDLNEALSDNMAKNFLCMMYDENVKPQ